MIGQVEINSNPQEERMKINETLVWIDQRIAKYLSLCVEVIEFYNKEKVNEAEGLLITALRAAFFYDFYAETGDIDFLNEADRHKNFLYNHNQISAQDKEDLQKIESQIMKLFEYEKKIGDNIKAGSVLSDSEIKKHWQMKSADALFYGRIINIFTDGKNLIPDIYAYTQILDMLLDIREYEQDLKKQELNMLYMRLLRVVPSDKIPTSKLLAIELANSTGVSDNIKEETYNIAHQLKELNSDAISSAIEITLKEIEIELTPPSYETYS